MTRTNKLIVQNPLIENSKIESFIYLSLIIAMPIVV